MSTIVSWWCVEIYLGYKNYILLSRSGPSVMQISASNIHRLGHWKLITLLDRDFINTTNFEVSLVMLLHCVQLHGSFVWTPVTSQPLEQPNQKENQVQILS